MALHHHSNYLFKITYCRSIKRGELRPLLVDSFVDRRVELRLELSKFKVFKTSIDVQHFIYWKSPKSGMNGNIEAALPVPKIPIISSLTRQNSLKTTLQHEALSHHLSLLSPYRSSWSIFQLRSHLSTFLCLWKCGDQPLQLAVAKKGTGWL